jgi:predicted DNA repair protein MutK
MTVLSIVGTAAMTWVGGSIVAHGLYEFGLVWPEHVIEGAAHWAEHTFPAIAAFAGWLATAFVDFFIGLALGALLIPVAGYIIAPALRGVKGLWKR